MTTFRRFKYRCPGCGHKVDELGDCTNIAKCVIAKLQAKRRKILNEIDRRTAELSK